MDKNGRSIRFFEIKYQGFGFQFKINRSWTSDLGNFEPLQRIYSMNVAQEIVNKENLIKILDALFILLPF